MQQAIIIIDPGFGDAGKGTMTDYLARKHEAHTVIRFNGGPQAAHNVITPDGRHHTFAQFGSASFLPNVQTYLSRFMLIEPYAMFNEAEHLHESGVDNIFSRTLIDRDAPIITPFHQAANRLREIARGDNRHGSCGMGIGEVMLDLIARPQDMLRAGNLPYRAAIMPKLRTIRDAKFQEIIDIIRELRDVPEAKSLIDVFYTSEIIEIAADNYIYLSDLIQLADDNTLKKLLVEPGTLLFEGAQGVLLDEVYGFAPYTTWSNTTFANAETLLDGYEGEITRLGVLRTYQTRHGAGPFVTEEPDLFGSLPEAHNVNNTWQQSFRVGVFDLLTAQYALDVVGGVDALALTHVDKLSSLPDLRLCEAYQSDALSGFLDPFFEHEGDCITRIKVKRPTDWAHQEELTRYLFRCKPVYTAQTSPEAFIARIGESLRTPIRFLSHGPTATDKQEISLSG